MIKTRIALLAVATALAVFVAGCGDDDKTTADSGGTGTQSSAAGATEVAGKNADDAMAKDDAAMKADGAGESGGDAMKKDGDAAMKADGDAMKEDGDAMKKDGDAMAVTGATVKVGATRFGKILQDGRGRTLYLFTKEKTRKSECYGKCADAWPPLYTKGKPKAGKGASAGKLGVTKRRHGKLQVTYNGHPLYYYVGEDEPDEVLCQGVDEFGGVWYVVNRGGDAITKSG